MAQSYGLIKNNGTIENGTGDFTSTKQGKGVYSLKFDRNVHSAIIVATVRQFPYCDTAGIAITVCNDHRDDTSQTIGVTFDSEYDSYGFSFILID